MKNNIVAYTLNEDAYIADDGFQRFMDYCFQHSDYFSLTRQSSDEVLYNQRQDAFLSHLLPYKCDEIKTNRWFRISVSHRTPLTVYLYRTEVGAKKIIQSTFQDLYLYCRVKAPCFWMPEDICFFRDEKLWLGTLSHEEICTAFVNTHQQSQEICSFSDWHIDCNSWVMRGMLDLSEFRKS
mgnify:CR=1 FL=1